MSYHAFKCDDGTEYGSFEVFYADARMVRQAQKDSEGMRPDEASPITETGWYWWACFPGCMPDGNAMGPFQTEREAIEDAREETTP